MKVLFRADCDRSIGTGHLFRCRQVADYFSIKGMSVHFLVNDGDFTKKTLTGYAYSTIEFTGIDDEIIATEDFLSNKHFDIIVVDFVEKNKNINLMQVFNRHAAQAVIAITDDHNPVSVNSHILIASHPKQKAANYISDTPIVLTGERYQLLSPEFTQNRVCLQGRVRNVLVSFGGHDPDKVSLKVARYLGGLVNKQSRESVKFHFLIGGISRYGDELEAILRSLNLQFEFHHNLDSVIPLFSNMDIAVTAGGNTLYELCHMAIPVIAIGLNERQHEACSVLHDKGVIKYLGFHDQVDQSAFLVVLESFLSSYEKRADLHSRCLRHFDVNPLDELYSLLTIKEV